MCSKHLKTRHEYQTSWLGKAFDYSLLINNCVIEVTIFAEKIFLQAILNRC
jgi:hypothetical protein